ncbi:hypothetical protein HX799_03080 [Pseudomonas tolaasii]|uniref:hypothetical protein n=1 Tax=Pseudomonas tolaasii TaxID=29442 RepID=UPI0015BC84B2|nr:hypothetical protein [Pseudomonas tolaasii]NWC50142.1 hypothetical protein [Pseudomonas tolaasii]
MIVSFRNYSETNPERPNLGTLKMLLTQAKNVVESVFNQLGTPPPARNQQLQTLYERMGSFEIQPHQDKQVDLIIRQGQVAIEEQLIEHADTALRQAVYVQFIHDNHLPPQSTSGATTAYEHHLQEMIKALMLANRHMAMLEALKNLEGKHYGVRAALGGHAKNQQPSNKMTSQLIRTMVKGMLYNKPDLANKNKTEVADAMATRIYKANREFEMLDITNINNLKHEVRDLLFDFANIGKRGNRRQTDRLRLGHTLRHSFPKRDTEEAHQMDVDAARTSGRIEGVKTVLTLQLKQRFGELSGAIIEALEATDDLDQLQIYLERLTEAQTPDDVFQNSL